MRKVNQLSSFGLVVVLGLLAMLMPLSIDMYLPAFPEIAREFSVQAGSVQMTLNVYVLGFAIGQLFYGPLSDSFGRKPIIVVGTLIFSLTTAACALSQSIHQLITLRFLHGLAAAAGIVVIGALIRDIFSKKEEFSRMMSFVMMVTTIAPLLAPIVGGWLLILWSWHAIFWSLSITGLLACLMVLFRVRETLAMDKRQDFSINTTLSNFASLLRHTRVINYMLITGFSFAGLFAFLNLGPFIYIEVHHIPPQHFGYYFGINVIFLFIMTFINSRSVRRFGPLAMFHLGLLIQLISGIWLLLVSIFDLGFFALVLGVASYIGCVAMVSSNAMAVILDEFPHISGTASSLAGTLRFGIGALIGSLLSVIPFDGAWVMASAIAFCAILSFFLFIYTNRRCQPD